MCFSLHCCLCMKKVISALQLFSISFTPSMNAFVAVLRKFFFFFANYGNGRQISNTRLRCSANHSALSQLANQSPPSVSEGGAL